MHSCTSLGYYCCVILFLLWKCTTAINVDPFSDMNPFSRKDLEIHSRRFDHPLRLNNDLPIFTREPTTTYPNNLRMIQGDIFVAKSGSNSTTCGSIYEPCSLPYAIRYSASNTNLLLLPGIYEVTGLEVCGVDLVIGAYNGSESVNITCINGKSDKTLLSFFNSTSQIKNISFTDCTYELGNGGAAYIDTTASVTFIWTHFINNRLEKNTPVHGNNFGGAAVSCLGSCNYTDCLFLGNTVSTSGNTAYGGALYMIGSGYTFFERCNFSDNSVSMKNAKNIGGGAVAILSCSTVQFISCNFFFNEALGSTAYGGAIYISDISCSATFQGCQFENNSIVCKEFSGGGAVFAALQHMEIYSSIFLSNSITGPCTAAAGGAIALSITQYVKLSDCNISMNFVNFTQNGLGGALTIEGVPDYVPTFIVELCRFMANSVVTISLDKYNAQGGAIAIFGNNNTFISIIHNLFHLNSAICNPSSATIAMAAGGAISIEGGTIFLTSYHNIFAENYVIGGNSTEIGGEAWGGAFYILAGFSESIATFNQDRFENNSVTSGSGLPARLYQYQQYFESGGIAKGGALMIYAFGLSSPIFPVATILNTHFINNKALGGNGAPIVDQLILMNGGNAGNAMGGALSSNWNISIIKSIFMKNNAIGGSPGSGNNKDFTSTGIASLSVGGALHLFGSFQLVNSSHFINNFIGNSTTTQGTRAIGGAIFSILPVDIHNCTLLNNSAFGEKAWGGAVYGSKLLAENTTFSNNTVYGEECKGGAVYSSVIMTFGNTTFLNNSAFGEQVWGGAVYGSELYISNTTFHNNSVYGGECKGGAVYGSVIIINDNSTFLNNSAFGEQVWGGAAYGSELYISNTTFHNNSVYGGECKGGAVFAASVHISDNTTFHNNTAIGIRWSRGGAIAIEQGRYNDSFITNTNFLSNIAQSLDIFHNNSAGGAIYVDSRVILSSLQCIFLNNIASYGGGIFFDQLITGSESNLQATNFTMNNASIGGGAIFYTLPFSNVAIENCTSCFFKNNIALYGYNTASNANNLHIQHWKKDYIPLWPGARFNVSLEQKDVYDQTVIRKDIQVILVARLNDFDSGVPIAIFLDGIYSYPRIEVTGRKQETFPLIFTTVPTNPTDPTLSTQIDVKILDCPPSMIKKSNKNSTYSTTCVSCGYGNYSFNGIKCKECPGGKPCIQLFESNYSIVIQRGFWPDKLENPSDILQCPQCNSNTVCILIPLVEKWIWNVSCNDTICTKGASDRLCTKCDCNDNENCWFYLHPNECEKCQPPSIPLTIVGTIICSLGVLIFIFINNAGTPLFIIGAIVLMFLPLMGIGQMYLILLFIFILANGGIPSGLTKSFLFYLQMLNFIYTSRMWPDWLKQVAQRFDWINFRITDISCLNISILQPPIGEYVFFMIFPFILVLITSFMLLCRRVVQQLLTRCYQYIKNTPQNNIQEDQYSAIEPSINNDDEEDDCVMIEDTEGNDNNNDKKEHIMLESSFSSNESSSWQSLKYKIISSSLFIIYSVHFRLSKVILEKFEPCQSGFMAQYLWIPCDISDTNFEMLITLSIFFTVTFVLGIPLLFGYLLYRNRNNIRSMRGERTTEECLGFIYKSFEPQFFWWEMIWFLRRILLVIALAIVPSDNAFHAPLVIMLLAISLILHHTLKPMRNYMENMMEGVGLLALLLTYAASIRTYDDITVTLDNTTALETVILALNGCVCVVFVILLCRSPVLMLVKKLPNHWQVRLPKILQIN